jgi:hypothetical protein
VTVANLTTAYAALCACFAGTEWWEVIMQQEALIAALQDIVNQLLIELCAKGTSGE